MAAEKELRVPFSEAKISIECGTCECGTCGEELIVKFAEPETDWKFKLLSCPVCAGCLFIFRIFTAVHEHF
jgi:hypothetical protein